MQCLQPQRLRLKSCTAVYMYVNMKLVDCFGPNNIGSKLILQKYGISHQHKSKAGSKWFFWIPLPHSQAGCTSSRYNTVFSYVSTYGLSSHTHTNYRGSYDLFLGKLSIGNKQHAVQRAYKSVLTVHGQCFPTIHSMRICTQVLSCCTQEKKASVNFVHASCSLRSQL